jgi:replicative DNA helicase
VALAEGARIAPVPSAGPSEFDRTPPQDVEAERSVLGGMLLSKDAIADVVEVIRPGDFYYPANQLIYDAILDLYSRGDPADAVTISAELTRSGQLMRVGGGTYLHTLVSTVPTAANASYYAQIVAERAVLRRLVAAGTRIVQMGYDTASGSVGVVGSVDDVVDRAQAEIYDVTERRASEDYSRIEDLLQGTWDELEHIMDRGGVGTGIPTGFSRLDEITNGLHPGQMVTVAGRPGSGKALALDTRLVTPTGWKTMGSVQVGDELIGADGRPTRVVAATEVMHGRPCYEVEFSDGTVITADAEHQWRTTTSWLRGLSSATTGRRVVRANPMGGQVVTLAPSRKPLDSIMTTDQLATALRTDPELHPAIRCAGAIQLPHRGLPRSPYDIGMSLGAGRIPIEYLRASGPQRRELLAGLLPGRGYMGVAGSVVFERTEQGLPDGTLELLAGLGYRRSIVAGHGAPVGSLTFTNADRRIVDVRRVESVPVRCVQVDNDDHMYLAGDSMVPTHNSTLALDWARSAAIKHNKPTVIFSLEMGRTEIMMRLLSAEAGVPLASMRSGHMTDQDWQRMARRSGEMAEAPLYIDDSANLTMMEIRAKSRRLKQRNDLQLIVIDYLQLMTSGKRVESRQQEVSEFSRAIKLLAKELEVPVVALSQLNRGSEQRTDKKPMLSDLRESGSIEQDSDMVVLVHREDMYEPESPRAGEADLILAKHRNGPTAVVAVAFQGRYSRFTDMPQ